MEMCPTRVLSLVALVVSSVLLAQCGGASDTTICKGFCGSFAGEVEFLYVTSNTHGGEILSFSIDHNSGMLGAPASVPASMAASGIATAQNHFLYVASVQAGVIDAYEIDPGNGALAVVPGSPFSPSGQVSYSPLWLVAGAAVYTTAQNGINSFSIGPDGALSTVVGSPYAGGFSGKAVLAQTKTTAANTFLFATNSLDPDGRISVFQIIAPASGLLTPVTGDFFTGANTGPGDIVFSNAFSTPYVFVALKNSKQIAMFSAEPSTGALTPVPHSPFYAGFDPTSLALDGTQKFLYVLNSVSGTIAAFGITENGNLTSVGSPFAVGPSPASIATTPDNFLYVTLPHSNTIEGFTINSSNGGLTVLPSSPFAALEPVLLSVAKISSQ
jgi:6-phosphogluconolactonase